MPGSTLVRYFHSRCPLLLASCCSAACLLRPCESAVPEQRVCAVIQGLLEADAGGPGPGERWWRTPVQTPPSAGNPVAPWLNTLDGWPDAKRIRSPLLRCSAHHPYLRSKVFASLARGGRNTQLGVAASWPTRTLRAANAVEALWGNRRPGVARFAQGAGSMRTTAVGRKCAIEIYRSRLFVHSRLLKMARKGRRLFRSTAAWAMVRAAIRDSGTPEGAGGRGQLRRSPAGGIFARSGGSGHCKTGVRRSLAHAACATPGVRRREKRCAWRSGHAGGPTSRPSSLPRSSGSSKTMCRCWTTRWNRWSSDRLVLAFLIH